MNCGHKTAVLIWFPTKSTYLKISLYYPHTGVQRTPVGSSQAYISVFLSLRPVFHVAFLWSKCTAHNYAQRMWQRAMGSNTLSGSIICLSARLSVGLPSHPQDFCNFCICINFQCGGPAPRCIYWVGCFELWFCVTSYTVITVFTTSFLMILALAVAFCHSFFMLLFFHTFARTHL